MDKMRPQPFSWKESLGIKYYMVRNPTTSPYVPTSEPDPIIRADSSVKGDMVRKKVKGRRIAGQRNTMKAKKLVQSNRVPSQRARATNLKFRGRSGRQGASEVAARSVTAAHVASVYYALWRDIQSDSDKTAKMIKKYGGVLLMVYVWMDQFPNPDIGTSQMTVKGLHMLDAGEDWIDVFHTKGARRLSPGRKNQIGTRPDMSGDKARDFPRPPSSNPPYGKVEDYFLVWAQSARKELAEAAWS